jgi:SAM-dependent methyltransferase
MGRDGPLMRLNLGSGNERRKGHWSVDLRRDADVDVVADVRALPFRSESVAGVLASDCLEHFPAARTAPLLAEWQRVLASGGRLTVRVPNLFQLCRGVMACEETRDWSRAAAYIRNIYGGHKYGPDGAWDTHHTGWLSDMLYGELSRAGFEVESDDQALNCTIVARRR